MKLAVIDFRDHEKSAAFFDEAFRHPRRRYVVRPADVEVARRWLRENASARHFGWGPAERTPMRLGDLMSMDTLYYRNCCGYVADDDGERCENNGYLCDAQPDEHSLTCEYTGKRLCHTFQCPVAYEADREDIRRKDPDLWRNDYKPYPDDEPEGWMVLSARPRYAFVANVRVLGCGAPWDSEGR